MLVLPELRLYLFPVDTDPDYFLGRRRVFFFHNFIYAHCYPASTTCQRNG